MTGPVLKGTIKYFELTNPEISQELERGNPVLMDYILPGQCNFKCLKCFSEGSEIYDKQLIGRGITSSELSSKEKEQLINEAVELGIRTLLVAGAGEPMVSPYFNDLINISSKYPELNTIVFTNGSMATREITLDCIEKGVNLIFSIDAITRDTFDKLSGTRGHYRQVMINLANALTIANQTSETEGNTKISRIGVNTTPTLISYNEERGIDEIKYISQLISGRAPHFVTRLSPFGNAKQNWRNIANTHDFSNNPTLETAIERYGNGETTSARSNGTCAALNNGIAIYKGHWMLCPDAGVNQDFGRYPETNLKNHWREKKDLLRKQRRHQCVSQFLN